MVYRRPLWGRLWGLTVASVQGETRTLAVGKNVLFLQDDHAW